MSGPRRALAPETLGAWLVKAAPSGMPMAELVRTGFTTLTSRCVRPSYRTDLVRAGQPVLLWLSGRDPDHPAGIHAQGWTTGPATDEMPVRLRPVHPVITRDQVLAVPGLAGAEVLRMPAGSNPSFLDVGQYRALREAFPQVAAPTPATRLAPVKTFEELWAELSEKAASRPEGSGTVRALDAGVHAIGKKLVEEAAESWMAAEHEGHERAAEEISQLLYHAQVLMLAAGISLDDVYSHL